MWIGPEKWSTNRKNGRINRKNGRIFLNIETGKQNTKTACAKKDSLQPFIALQDEHVEAPGGGRKGPPRMSYCSWPDSQTFAGLRTPAYGWTPTGAGPTGSPRLCRGFGHLLTVIAWRNPAPSRDAAPGLTPYIKLSRRVCNSINRTTSYLVYTYYSDRVFVKCASGKFTNGKFSQNSWWTQSIFIAPHEACH